MSKRSFSCYYCYCIIELVLDVFLQRFKVNMFPNESKLSVYGIKTVIHKDPVYMFAYPIHKHILNTTQMHSEYIYQLVCTTVHTNQNTHVLNY